MFNGRQTRELELFAPKERVGGLGRFARGARIHGAVEAYLAEVALLDRDVLHLGDTCILFGVSILFNFL